jgi:hypothetical protein
MPYKAFMKERAEQVAEFCELPSLGPTVERAIKAWALDLGEVERYSHEPSSSCMSALHNVACLHDFIMRSFIYSVAASTFERC